jgi:hypothetical protein
MTGKILLQDISIGLDCRVPFAETHLLHFTSDGNLELWDTASQTLVWQSGTGNRGAARLSMQEDGNLVIYDAEGAPLWASDTADNPGAALVVESGGEMMVCTVDQKPIWKTNGGSKAA